jgi:hypothetical protein
MGRGYDGANQGQLYLPEARTEREKTLRAQTRRAATRTVAGRAGTADDLRLLLDVLGLNPNEGRTP